MMGLNVSLIALAVLLWMSANVQGFGIYHLYNVTENDLQQSKDLQKQRSNQDGCYIGGRYLKFGDQWTQRGICGLFACQEKHYRTLATPCPHLRYQEGSGCRITEEDLTQDFPDCCPKMFCPNEKEVKQQQKKSNWSF
uniref:Single domain-containing protein n=1 Tax=Graphocephala atropunctata TaxID=36148 RepID=A0A1B6LYZ5_9HEMI